MPSYLSLVIWSRPLSSADDLGETGLPLVIMTAVTQGVLGLMALRTWSYPDRPHLWRATGWYALVAAPASCSRW